MLIPSLMAIYWFTGGAGGVLRASGADADGLEKKDGKCGDRVVRLVCWWCATRLRRGC
jgi:hypothetical protein